MATTGGDADIATRLARAVHDGRVMLRMIATQFVEDGCTNTAASLTYTTLFAVVPLMTVTYSILSLLPDFQGVGETIEGFVFDNFVPTAGEVVRESLRDFSAQARQLTAVGLVFVFGTALMMLFNIERAFNRIWRVRAPRRGLNRFLVYWGFLTCGPPLVVGAVMTSSYLFSLPLVGDVDVLGLRGVLLSVLPWVVIIALFVLLFFAVPNTRVRLQHALAGAVLTTIAFQLAVKLFAFVVSNSTIDVIYGTFAAVPMFLSWLYLCWVLVLVGAVTVRVLDARPRARGPAPPEYVVVTRILAALRAAAREGRTLGHADLVRLAPRLDVDTFTGLIGSMEACGWIVRTHDDACVLGIDPRAIRLWDVCSRFPAGILSPPDDPAGGDHAEVNVRRAVREFVSLGRERLDADMDTLLDGAVADRASGAADGRAEPAGVGARGPEPIRRDAV